MSDQAYTEYGGREDRTAAVDHLIPLEFGRLE
jgi:hypothetical protein